MKPKLHVPRISTDTFLNKGKFIQLKAYFYQNDMQFSSMDEFQFDKHITGLKGVIPARIATFDMNGGEFEYVFDIDYLPVALDHYSKTFLGEVWLESRSIYGPDAKIDYLEQHSNNILKALDHLPKIKFLNAVQKDKVKTTMDTLLDAIDERISQLKLKKTNKLQLNLKKGDAVYLFKILHELNIIKGIPIYDVMRFVEDNFNFSGNKEINGANKALNTYLTRHPVTKFEKETLIDFINKITE